MQKKERTKSKRLPSTAFEAGNKWQFAPGVSGNPSGRSKASEQHLISRALHEQLGYRAPNNIAERFNLPKGSSWAQCVSMALIFAAVRGDISAAKEIRDAIGDVSAHPIGGLAASVSSSTIVVQFVSAKDAEAATREVVAVPLSEAA